MPAEEAVPLAPSEAPMDDKGAFVEGSDRAKLREILTYYAVENPDVLRHMLEEVPESAKPALLEAIAVLEAGYGRALAALD
jgi:hypothetical protein